MPDGTFRATTFRSLGGTTAREGNGEQPAESPVDRWLASDDAQRFQGLWVFLGDHIEPRDSDLSPIALKERHASSEDAASVIVYVPPADELLA